MGTKATPVSSPPAPVSGWRIGTEGRCWLLLTVALIAIGAVKGANLLLLLSYLMALVISVNALLARRSLRGLVVRRRIGEPVFAGQPCSVEVEISTAGQVRGLGLEDSGPDHALSWFLPRLVDRERQTLRQSVALPQRGRYAWGPLLGVSGAPFGLLRRWGVLVPGAEVLVLPQRGGLHRGRFRSFLHSRGLLRERIRRRAQPHRLAQAELHGLRTFRPGDSPRWIHWRTSARRGELMVREMSDLPSENLLVVFDPAPPAPGPAQRQTFEDAISLAATICWEWCRHPGLQLTLAVAGPAPVVIEGLTSSAHARRLLEQLAVVEMSAAPSVGLMTQLAATPLPSAAVVVVAAGPSNLVGPLRQALQRPVNSLDAGDLAGLDFYDPPARCEDQLQ